MKKQIVEHIEELKKYPQKILMLIGLILMIIGLILSSDKIVHPVLYLGVDVAIFGLILYIRKLFICIKEIIKFKN